MALPKYSKLTRTTIGEYYAHLIKQDNGAGVYVIASFPNLGVVYVGISDNVMERMAQHGEGDTAMVDCFLRANWAQACGWRLDVMTPPEDCDTYTTRRAWLESTENALIQRFNPVCNVSNSPRSEG